MSRRTKEIWFMLQRKITGQERVLAYHETTKVQAHQWPRLERLHSHTVCVPESTQEAMPCPSLLRQGGLIRRQTEREVRVRLGDSSI